MTRVSLAGGRIDEKVDVESVHRISQDPTRNWEVWWQRGGELLNPILVKEVRQALKSRQFEVSFGLTLLAAVCWTFLFMSFNVPRIFYVPGGGTELLRGYAFILLVPLLIIIPFSAFRSLTSEVEESTFELLSITSLSAKQIVTGKMATAALQILLYVLGHRTQHRHDLHAPRRLAPVDRHPAGHHDHLLGHVGLGRFDGRNSSAHAIWAKWDECTAPGLAGHFVLFVFRSSRDQCNR